MAGEYDYDWLGYGLILHLPEGTVFLQGDEAAELYDELERINDPAVLAAVLVEYSVLIEGRP